MSVYHCLDERAWPEGAEACGHFLIGKGAILSFFFLPVWRIDGLGVYTLSLTGVVVFPG